jgi:3-dehydroquinate synthase
MNPASVIVSENSFADLITCLDQLVLQQRKLFVLTDENTHANCLTLLNNTWSKQEVTEIIVIKNDEQNKSIESCNIIWAALLNNKADRKSVLLNLGGGFITDLGGFAASVFKRGIAFINIPTTLLAMTDAAIGGKTGLNTGGYKNQIGTFALPLMTYCYLPFLNTLPERQLRSGAAEMIKHGLIADKDYFFALKNEKMFNRKNEIEKSIAIKSAIAIHDIYENGERQLLNFGHTIGHALESYSYQTTKPLLHGEAVAAGMLCESYLSHIKCGLTEKELVEITACIKSVFNFNSLTIQTKNLVPYFLADKKNENNEIRFTLLQSIGKGITRQAICEKEINASIDWFIKNN